MKRRNFIRNTAISSWFLPSLAFTACSKPSSSVQNENLRSEKFEIEEATLTQLQELMESGDYTSQKITKLYLERIEKLDRSGPRINSLIELNPNAMEIAKTLDIERSKGLIRGPLHGIPIVIKDNIDTADQMMTTAGAMAMVGNYAKNDAPIVKSLKEAGAIILGKANLSEWANFRSTRSSSGWSSRGGQTRNPYVIDRNPCGSSSGTGASVSANFCAVGIGTETNGSIVCPSSTNGLVGLKPTVGAVSRTGIIPISHTQDTAGPMTRSVSDAAKLFFVLISRDELDIATHSIPEGFKESFSAPLVKESLKGKKLGLWKSRMGFHEEVDRQLEESFRIIRQEGAEIIEIGEVIENISELYRPSRLILEYEFKAGVNAYLSEHAGPMNTLQDIIDFNKQNSEKAMPFFQMEILESSQEKSGLESKEYLDAKALVQTRSREGILDTLKKYNLDAIIAPTGGPAWVIDVITGDHFGGGSSSPAAWSGFPNLTVPAGWVHGLPIGLSFFAEKWSERKLLDMGYAFELARKSRRPPTFLPTISM